MEYTGIENIYLNGTMMGFSREEVDARLQDILDFADIGDFVYQPVKAYSSGMFVRLAFAVAINIDPDPDRRRGSVCGRRIFPGQMLP